ncbi:hypothetical protein GXM_02759 [Nostoc sphaeroides CCNUC1]|uniref:Uncharacterized protein n=1 Tax=Nostoc sphaeroides CCNUC1 TaxID=2653204 RepID=A0A5P8VXZ4_9NOSO|nr:hypothetical protein GXM_02759 [Nostoc sphaeroides CCNUC1]
MTGIRFDFSKAKLTESLPNQVLVLSILCKTQIESVGFPPI